MRKVLEHKTISALPLGNNLINNNNYASLTGKSKIINTAIFAKKELSHIINIHAQYIQILTLFMKTLNK